MPVSPTYPGVYVQEVPSGVRTIVGVGTSTGLFLGSSKKGPIAKPVRCLNYSSFRTTFGEDTTVGDLSQYMRLFFTNGGTDAYVMRIANGALASSVTLRNEANTADALILTAKDPGLAGEDVRAIVTYSGAQPEATFNIELYALELQGGQQVKTRQESWVNLSMNPASSLFAPTFLTQNSKLVDAANPGVPAATIQGFSQSGRAIPHASSPTGFRGAWAALIGTNAAARNRFALSVDGSPYIDIDLNVPTLDVANLALATIRTPTGLSKEIQDRITTQFAANGIAGVTVTVTFEIGPVPNGAAESTLLRIASTTNGDVYVRPAGTNDLAVPLMLGTGQGGLEVSAFANRRPAPNGITLRASDPTVLTALGTLLQNAFTAITLDRLQPPPLTGFVPAPAPVPLNLVTTVAADRMFQDGTGVSSPNQNSDGVREKLGLIAAAINSLNAVDPLFPWTAQLAGSRLSIVPTGLSDANFLSSVFALNGFNVVNFLNNVKAYSLGAGGLNIGSRQVAGTTGSDGVAPLSTDYDAAYRVIDKEIDLFNLMVLAPVTGAGAVPVQNLYGAASVFCQSRRAFLVMDPPSSWTDSQIASAGVSGLRVGLVKDYAALFFPRVTVDDAGLKKQIGAAGAIAGLFARIDGTRGVWKAPAGTEADLRGVVGLERQFSDGENGTLNPKAINTLRVFPNGIVNWGARTMDGDDSFASEYKYIPVRRLALYMEESLYRGLKWVVFEPNDEPLWSQIRLNVGAFMHNLFRQGAFQGRTPRDAYFVKCDSETTTQNDINLGIVNIWVGFAPLKPAEFVILYLQQMAGQIQT
jgi:uncharacterized protein